MAVTRINELQAKEDRAEDLKHFLSSVISRISACDGCRSARLFQDQQAPAQFMIVEVWDSIEAHKKAMKNISKNNFGQVLELLAEPPSGTYYTQK